LSSVKKRHTAKEFFAGCLQVKLDEDMSMSSVFFRHLAKNSTYRFQDK
jgi:hypothetical protein